MAFINNLDVGTIVSEDQGDEFMMFDTHDRMNDCVCVKVERFFCYATLNSIIAESLTDTVGCLKDEPEYYIPRIKEFITRLRRYADKFEALLP